MFTEVDWWPHRDKVFVLATTVTDDRRQHWLRGHNFLSSCPSGFCRARSLDIEGGPKKMTQHGPRSNFLLGFIPQMTVSYLELFTPRGPLSYLLSRWQIGETVFSHDTARDASLRVSSGSTSLAPRGIVESGTIAFIQTLIYAFCCCCWPTPALNLWTCLSLLIMNHRRLLPRNRRQSTQRECNDNKQDLLQEQLLSRELRSDISCLSVTATSVEYLESSKCSRTRSGPPAHLTLPRYSTRLEGTNNRRHLDRDE